MSFTNKKKRITYDYIIQSQSVSKVAVIKANGVKSSDGLTFKDHSNRIVSQAFNMTGFIKGAVTSFTGYIHVLSDVSGSIAVLCGIPGHIHLLMKPNELKNIN